MDADFWRERWANNRIGFHQDDYSKLLMKHWPSICPDTSAEVFVPLCGKSRDMLWLAERGHRVVGVELSEIAVRDFFAEAQIVPEREVREGFEIKRSGPLEIWCGDFFAFPKDRLSDAQAAYDRASLIALPSDMRRRYAAQMDHLLKPGTATLLQTISYPDGEIDGPPFSVTELEVRELYAQSNEVSLLEERDATATSRNLTERGASRVGHCHVQDCA